MILGVGHIGIAVKDIEESVRVTSKALDLPMPAIRDVPDRKMKVALLNLYGIGLEFIQDYSENGEFAEFARERGDAIHHFCLLTDDIEAEADSLEERGVELRIRKPTVILNLLKLGVGQLAVLPDRIHLVNVLSLDLFPLKSSRKH